MSNILAAKISIKGTRLHIQHRFTPDALPLEKQERTGVAGNDPEEWKRTCILNKNRAMVVLPQMIFGMFCANRDGAARHVKNGRGNAVKAFASTLQVLEDSILLTRNGSPIVLPDEPERILEGAPYSEMPDSAFILISAVVNPGTKARNVRYRVSCKPGWECSFALLFDKTIVSRQMLEQGIQAASKLVGLSNSRAIGHGRFRVQSLEFVDDAESLLDAIAA